MSTQLETARKQMIYVHSTRGDKMYESSAQTVGELRQEFREQGVDFNPSEQLLMENQNFSALLMDESLVPTAAEGTLILTITPINHKGNSELTRPECYAFIKSLDKKVAKDNFSFDGKPYSSRNTQELNELIQKFKSSTKSVAKTVKKVVKEQPKVESKSEPKEEGKISPTAIQEALELIKKGLGIDLTELAKKPVVTDDLRRKAREMQQKLSNFRWLK